jgi:Flp pilus assembly protein TadD
MYGAIVRSIFVTVVLLGLLQKSVGAQPSLSSASPFSATQYRQLGLRYREQERLPEAIATLQKAVELDPDNLSGRVMLGWTLHLAEQDQAATHVLEQTLHHNPFHIPTLNALGIVYLVNNRLVAAVTTHGWATALKPDNEIAHYNLSLGFHRLQQYHWAIAAAQTAMELEPNNPHPIVALAIAHWDNGETAIDHHVYRQAIHLDPRYRDAMFLRHLEEAGFSTNQIEKSQEVLESFQKKFLL